MNLEDIKQMARDIRGDDLEKFSDTAILREADKRGLHLGVSYCDLSQLTKHVVLQDWANVHKCVAKLARDNLGVII